MGHAIIFIISSLITLAVYLVLANAVLSWLVAFDVVNIRNRAIGQIVRALDAMTEPMLRPIRRFMPNLGGVDISPIILFIILQGVQVLINYTLEPLLVGALG